MVPRAQPALRNFLRTSTSTLRTTPSTQIPRSLPQQLRPRSPSPTPTFESQSRNLSISSTQWTRFNTAYSLSSVRTFTSSRTQWRPNEEVANAQTDPEAVQRIEEAIEEIQELYGTARDEFEIASEETEKNTTYAPDDRAAAREELDKLLGFYTGVIEGQDRAVAEEVKRRVGQRIRELEQAVKAMEEAALHGD